MSGAKTYLWDAGTVRSKKTPPEHASRPKPDRIAAVQLGTSETRAERLARLKRAIDDGSYRIAAEDIADKVIDRLRKNPAKT